MGQQTVVDVIWQILIFSALKYLCVKFLELLDQLLRFVFIKYYIYKSFKKKGVPTCTGLVLLNFEKILTNLNDYVLFYNN